MANVGKAFIWLVVGAAAVGGLIFFAIRTPIPHDDLGAVGIIFWSVISFIKNLFTKGGKAAIGHYGKVWELSKGSRGRFIPLKR